MQVTRAAFATILSLNDNDKDCSFTDILMILDHIELTITTVDDKTEEKEVFEQLDKEFEAEGTLEPFVERWRAASRMRIWLQGKRKDISNDLMEQKDKAIAVEENKTLEEDQNEDTIAQEQKEVNALVEKVVRKAEFLINLSPPLSWNNSEISKLSLKASQDKDSSSMKKASIDKLKTIMEIQASKGSVLASENLTNRDLLRSCSTSVLSILQCSLDDTHIVDELLKRLSNCIKRIYGLEIVNLLLSSNKKPYAMFHHTYWFFKAFSWNKFNELCHYSDNLDGVGEYFMSKLKCSFFKVLKKIISNLQEFVNSKVLQNSRPNS